MRHRIATALCLTLIAFGLAIMVLAFCGLSGGCTAQQRASMATGAADVRDVTSPGNPTTQPAVAAGQSVVRVIETAAPVTTPIFAIISAIAGGLTILLGGAKIVSQSTQLAQHKSALGEVFGDIAQFKDPNTPWTRTTAKLLSDIVGLANPPPYV